MGDQLDTHSSSKSHDHDARRYEVDPVDTAAAKANRNSSGRLMLLPDVDEELDYSEDELPSLGNRSSTAKITHRHRSPREEGEEEFEESDDNPDGGDRYESGRPHRTTKTHSSFIDREEGEASSEEEKRIKKSVQQRKGSGDLALDELEYRNRLHARHERRARERLREDYVSAGVESMAEFAQPRPYFEPSTDSSQKERKIAKMPRRRSERMFGEGTHPLDSSSSDHMSHSLSTSYLLVQQQTAANLDVQNMSKSRKDRSSEHRHSSRSSREHSKTKSKKSKRSRPPSTELESEVKRVNISSQMRKVNSAVITTSPSSSTLSSKPPGHQLEYVDWESYMYAQMKLDEQKKEAATTKPLASPSTSHSSSPHSSRSSSPTNSRSPSAKHGRNEYPSGKSGKNRTKSKHYRRDMRETAPPPPDPMNAPHSSEDEWGVKEKRTRHRRHKTSRHSRDPKDPAYAQYDFPDHASSKRQRRSKEQKTSNNRKPRHEESKERWQDEISTNKEVTVKEYADVASKPPSKQEQPLLRSPFKTEPLSDESNHSNIEDEKMDTTSEAKIEPELGRKFEHKPGRFQPYRLYSESESDDADTEAPVDLQRGNEHEDDADLDEQHAKSDGADEELKENADMDSLRKPPPSKPFYFPSIQGCRSVEEFECLNRIEEGTYGVVYRARDKKINEIVALKRLKMEKERDGFPITSLREINTLMKAQHENIVTVREVVVGSNMDKIYLVMDYVEHDMKSLMEIMNGPFSVGEVKCLLTQLLKAVRHLHDNWILHRDLKTSNLLLSHQGMLKVGDFGLAREYGSPLKHYTEVVVTLWYRAPELLLGTKQYTCPIDLWSVGCIFAEFLLQRPLFPGKGEVDELNIIFRDLGTPTERIWPGVSQLPGMKKCVFTEYPYNQLRRRFTEKQISDQGFDLLNNFLTYCPEKRITADKALKHAYFQERPRAIHPSMFPSWPAKSEGGVAVRKNASPRPPAGGGALAAAAQAIAQAAGAAGGRVRYQPPAPPMGGQRFYSSMSTFGGGGADSRPGTAVGSASGDTGFSLRF